MTSELPDELAFLAFFESEPTQLDAEAPWIYNTLTYETDRDGYLVRCEISPSYSTLKVSLSADGREIAEVEVAEFTNLKIETERERETLIVSYGGCASSAVYLTLKPKVALRVLAGWDS